MRKMLQIITLAELGGAGRVVTSLINNLPKEEFDIVLVSGEGEEIITWLDSDARERVQHVQLKSLVRSIHPLKDLLAVWKLFRFIRKEKFEIVHCHSSKAGVIGRIAAKLAGAPKIYFTVHGWVMDEKQPWWLRTLYVTAERFAALCSTKIICVSEADQKKALKYKIADKKKLAVVHNGIEELQTNATFLRKYDKDKFLVTMVARLAPPKLPLLFLQTAKALREYKDILFVLIGGGNEEESCKQFIKEHKLGNVVMLGEMANAREHFYETDAAVLLSEHEGLPMVVIEAMFAGKPVIASHVGGISELIEYGETGYAVKNNVNEIAEKILKLYQDKTLLNNMGKKAYQRAQKYFTAQHMAEEYLGIYNISLLK